MNGTVFFVRVLLMTLRAPSHIHSRLAIARKLVEQGHHVGWLCHPASEPKLAEFGIEVLGLRRAPKFERFTGEERMRAANDPVRSLELLRLYHLGPLLDDIDAVREVIRSFRPDVIGLDGSFYQYVVASELEHIPWACLSSGLWLVQPRSLRYLMQAQADELAAERTAFFAKYGMQPDVRVLECVSPSLNIIATTRELLGDAAEWPPHTHAVGPTVMIERRGDEVPFPWERLATDRPIVYLSFGTAFYWHPHVVHDVAKACADLGAQLVASVMGLAADERMQSLPGDPVVVPYAPQLEMLQRASAFVNHGGAASVMESIYFGVPQLVIPFALDQPVQAFFVARSGVGTSLEPDRVSEDLCREALGSLLVRDGTARRRTAAIRETFRAADGATRAAELLLSIA